MSVTGTPASDVEIGELPTAFVVLQEVCLDLPVYFRVLSYDFFFKLDNAYSFEFHLNGTLTDLHQYFLHTIGILFRKHLGSVNSARTNHSECCLIEFTVIGTQNICYLQN